MDVEIPRHHALSEKEQEGKEIRVQRTAETISNNIIFHLKFNDHGIHVSSFSGRAFPGEDVADKVWKNSTRLLNSQVTQSTSFSNYMRIPRLLLRRPPLSHRRCRCCRESAGERVNGILNCWPPCLTKSERMEQSKSIRFVSPVSFMRVLKLTKIVPPIKIKCRTTDSRLLAVSDQ